MVFSYALDLPAQTRRFNEQLDWIDFARQRPVSYERSGESGAETPSLLLSRIIQAMPCAFYSSQRGRLELIA